MHSLYDIKGKWMGCFLRSHFFAGMTTKQRSEPFNALCNGRLGSSTLPMEFVTEFDRIVKSRREARVKANYERKMRTIENHPSPLMANGYKCFSTSKMTESIAYVIDEVTTIDFENLITTSRVRRHNQDGSAGNGRVVTYQASEQVVSCDCNEFSFSGILCRHALRFLLRHNVTAIMERCILKRCRWDSLLLDNEGSAEVGPAVSAEVSVVVRAQIRDNVAEVAGVVIEVAQVAAAAVSITVAEADATPALAVAFADFQHHLQHHLQRLLTVLPVVRNPAAVREKGRPRNASRIPSGVEASMSARQTKILRCGRCREYAHDGRNHDRIMMERSSTVVEETLLNLCEFNPKIFDELYDHNVSDFFHRLFQTPPDENRLSALRYFHALLENKQPSSINVLDTLFLLGSGRDEVLQARCMDVLALLSGVTSIAAVLEPLEEPPTPEIGEMVQQLQIVSSASLFTCFNGNCKLFRGH
ncbi:hypothetical protein PsorP6_000012 [Peronosclerospora sorghi]|uniref:Uncharacterized protein n=1 Tax=Peronosclerospora sorghi TaxID=230839 RepID=A0ACC0WTQ0_9STRA|nr:hypothetical protein PsorP6_000012 [Peronosclerospora sorghi]